MANPFTGPAVEAKLRAHPKTKDYMDDPEFLTKLQSLKLNPNTLMLHMKDPRVMNALGVLMGVDLSMMDGGGAGEGGRGVGLGEGLEYLHGRGFSAYLAWMEGGLGERL